MFLYKNLFFFNIYSFNPNRAYWNQRRLFSGNLPGMFSISFFKIEKFWEPSITNFELFIYFVHFYATFFILLNTFFYGLIG